MRMMGRAIAFTTERISICIASWPWIIFVPLSPPYTTFFRLIKFLVHADDVAGTEARVEGICMRRRAICERVEMHVCVFFVVVEDIDDK